MVPVAVEVLKAGFVGEAHAVANPRVLVDDDAIEHDIAADVTERLSLRPSGAAVDRECMQGQDLKPCDPSQPEPRRSSGAELAAEQAARQRHPRQDRHALRPRLRQ